MKLLFNQNGQISSHGRFVFKEQIKRFLSFEESAKELRMKRLVKESEEADADLLTFLKVENRINFLDEPGRWIKERMKPIVDFINGALEA